MEILLTILSIVLTAFVLPALRAWAQSHKQTAASTLLASVQSSLECAVSNRMERDYPILAKKILEDPLADHGTYWVREALYEMGEAAIQEVIGHYKVQGTDLIKALGMPFLQTLLRASVDHLSPFPGKSTAEVLVQPGVAKTIVEDGMYQEEMAIGVLLDDETDDPDDFGPD